MTEFGRFGGQEKNALKRGNSSYLRAKSQLVQHIARPSEQQLSPYQK